jgi:tetratricopeptide (TPR) repeat protein
VALGLALFERKPVWRMVYWTGFGLCGLALLVTFTRGAWIGGAVSLVLLAIIAWRQRVKLRRLDWIPAGIVGAAGIALIVRSLFDWQDVTNFGRRFASIFDFGSGEAHFRTRIWQAAAEAIEDRPLLGWGPDTFGLVFSKFKSIEYVRGAGGASGADNAHDYPLQLASGVGILGAVLFFAIWIWAGVRSWKTVFARHGDSSRLLLGAFWAASAGYLLHLMFGISVPGSSFLLWMALALVLVPTSRQIAVKTRRTATVAAAAVLLVAGLAIAGQAVALAADSAYTTAREQFSPRPLAERYDAADRAVHLNPLASEHYSTLAAVAREQMAADNMALAQARQTGAALAPRLARLEASFAVTEMAYENAIAFNPWDYANYVNLAAVYNSAGAVLDESRYQDAINTAERGLEVMPYGTHLRLELAKALLAMGRTGEAAETLEYYMELEPANGTAALTLATIYTEQERIAEALALLHSVETLAAGQPGVGAAIKALQEGLPLP